MTAQSFVVPAALGYGALLFAIAALAEARARQGRARWLRGPWVYTLSLSVYCTAWTFYGAVGYAARSGLEFATIYLGPTLVMIGWWWGLRKLVRIARVQRITSIADLVSSRFGKSGPLGAGVTLLALVGTMPYIALQLQSLTVSFAVLGGDPRPAFEDLQAFALWAAAGLALFTILFGTRALDASERHHGVVTAIAVEAIVKLVALVAVGLFVTFEVLGGPGPAMARISASDLPAAVAPGRWVGIMALAAAAFLTLPRMFHVAVVENADEGHLRTASWAFPLYLFAMSLFVVPIAVAGLEALPPDANPDLFVLTLPMAAGREWLALLAFLGGFSAATSMVIVAALALATMVSNHIVVPMWLWSQGGGAALSGDVRRTTVLSRRVAIGAVLLLGWAYWRASDGGEALAAIGLVSFVGVAQILPALLGGIFWRGGTRWGAAAGLVTGFAVWSWTLFLPSFGDGIVPAAVMVDGPFAMGWLRPTSLFGLSGMDPVVHAFVLSMLLNSFAFVAVSLVTFPTPLERLQGAAFTGVFESRASGADDARGADPEALMVMAQRLLGPGRAQAFFRGWAARQGQDGYLPDPTPEFLMALERELAGSVGGATADAMMAQVMGRRAISVADLVAVADETAQVLEQSHALQLKTEEAERAARGLRDANAALTRLARQKDAFLGQISHELRTPMTSIRAFADILMSNDLSDAERARYAGTVHDEAMRLTRLLDDLLDLSVLENGQVRLNLAEARLDAVIDRALLAAGTHGLAVRRDPVDERVTLFTDADRLVQVFANLVTNVRKYCDAESPELRFEVRRRDAEVLVDVVDNGTGIAPADRTVIFEKFARLGDHAAAGGAGLGLAISREIMERLGGGIAYLPGQGGTAFRVRLPRRVAPAGHREAAE
ncbi:Na+/proline symporter [Hasllibacter halocynthiae]|uniref:histidine kinase n=1 Tax=Hasllibacter halocynthiae TaxID=595589 RepID=A0A2T0X7F7_9RHOB|nr:sensor histidine kinase [Hasllibacter halocynthiae]PRY94866.1 Na+/proline symporter [Hasllibacter halocynthiae]